MKKLSIIVAIALLAVLAVALPVAAEPSEVWVCPSGDCEHPGVAYNSIQDGIDAVAANGTVHVAAGTYTENPSMTRPVNLEGPTEGTATIVGTLTIQNAGNIRINRLGFRAVGSNDSVVLNKVNGVTIANCAFDGAGGFMSGGRAVQINSPSSDVTIEGCTFTNGYYVTIQGRVDNLKVRSSTIENVKSGINLQGGNNLVVENTDISVIAQGATNDTYCIRFASDTAGSGNGMRLAGGTYTVDKAGWTASEDPKTYHSAIIVRSGATGTLQANWLSINGEVVNLSATKLDAGYNYWGSPAGPAPGQIRSEVVSSPWLTQPPVTREFPAGPALVVNAIPASVEGGQTFDADIYVVPGADEVFAWQFNLSFDQNVLEVKAVEPGGDLPGQQEQAGGYGWYVSEPSSANATGVITTYVTLLDNASGTVPGFTTLAHVARVTFQAKSDLGECGVESNLTLDNVKLTQKEPDGQEIGGVTADGDRVTVYNLVTAGGTVSLQGRNVHSGATVKLTGAVEQQPFSYAVPTAGDGAWSANVVCGTYDVYVDMMAYLDAKRDGATIHETYDAGSVKLLGGNAAENTPDKIFLDDVVAIADVIGRDVDSADPSFQHPLYPDINADNTINILDLVLAGINYTETGPKTF